MNIIRLPIVIHMCSSTGCQGVRYLDFASDFIHFKFMLRCQIDTYERITKMDDNS